MSGAVSALCGPFGQSGADLRDAVGFCGAVAANLAVMAAAEAIPVRSRVLGQALDDAGAKADLAGSLQSRLVAFALAWKVRTSVRGARRHTLASAAVITLGVVLFLVATQEPAGVVAGRPAPSPATGSSPPGSGRPGRFAPR